MTNTDDRKSRVKKAEKVVLYELKNCSDGEGYIQSLTVAIMGALGVSEGSARGYLKDMEGRKIIVRRGDTVSLA
jgi:hypothetical protein